MTLKGEARNKYMREYMRRRRAGEKPQRKPRSQVAPDTLSDSASAALVKELAQAKAELAQAKERMREMHLEHAAQGQAFRDQLKRRTAKPKVEKPALPPDEQRDRQIKSLKTMVHKLTSQMVALREYYDSGIAKKDGMSRTTFNAVVKCLHPESRSHVTKTELDEACGLFTQWKKDKDKALDR